MTGGIIRIERSAPGAYIPNATAHDARLKLDTLGLLTWLLAHGDGWTIMMGPLIAECSPRAPKARGGGRDWVRRMLAELETTGYVQRTRAHGPDGTWVWLSVISDVPLTVKRRKPVEGDASELETDPVLSGAVGAVVEAVKLGRPIDDLRAFVVTTLKDRKIPVTTIRIAQVIAAVHSRAPTKVKEHR